MLCKCQEKMSGFIPKLVSTMTSGERWPHIRETSPWNAFLPIFFDLALWKNSSTPVQLPAQHTTTCRDSFLGLISSMCWFDLLIIGDLLLQSHRWVDWWEIRLLKHGYLPLVGFLMLVFANGTADRITVQELSQKILQICYKTTDYYLFVCIIFIFNIFINIFYNNKKYYYMHWYKLRLHWDCESHDKYAFISSHIVFNIIIIIVCNHQHKPSFGVKKLRIY